MRAQVLSLAIAAIFPSAFPFLIYAQCNWTTGNGMGTCTTLGSVGIGTTSPIDGLNVHGGGITLGVPYESADTLNYTLTVQSMSPGIPYLSIQRAGDSGARLYQSGGYLHMQGDNGGATTSDVMVWSTNGAGYVGIGTTSPQQLLDVHGTIAAQEVIVSTTGADYVFESDYRLPSLTEVAAYIADHHHLPDIPSATEMKEKGVGVADMQAKLLAKIEELTLHMIQSEKENHDLRERISRLEAAAGGKEAQ